MQTQTPPTQNDLNGVVFDNSSKVIALQMKSSSYVMRVAADGLLEHLYWGPRIEAPSHLQYLAEANDWVAFDPGRKDSTLLEYSGLSLISGNCP